MSPFRPEVVFWNLLPYRTTKRVHQCMAYPLSQLFYPYVGIIQIRSHVEAIQLPLSLLDTQAPLFFIYIYYTPFFPHCNPYFLYNLIWIWYFFIQ